MVLHYHATFTSFSHCYCCFVQLHIVFIQSLIIKKKIQNCKKNFTHRYVPEKKKTPMHSTRTDFAIKAKILPMELIAHNSQERLKKEIPTSFINGTTRK